MKIVIFGCGKIGQTIVEALVEEGHDITVVDRDPKAVEELTNIYDVIGLYGNGVDSDILMEAGVDSAELFVAITGSDELNMLGCFLARRMGAGSTVARIRNPEYNDESLGYLKQQLDISMALNPERLTALEIFNILRFPAAVNVETFSGRNFEIVELILKEDSPFAGMKLSDLRRKYKEKFLVCSVLRDNEVFVPDGSFRLRMGDRIGITASHAEIHKLLKDMGMPQKHPRDVIILGVSRATYYLTRLLESIGSSVKIIERDPERCAEYAVALPNAVIIEGDGMDEEVLLEEGIDSTDAYIALTGSDEENILSAFSALGHEVPQVIAKVNRPEMTETARKLGLECIVSPKKTVSGVMSRYARALHNSMGSNVETLYKLMDGRAEVMEFKVNSDSACLRVALRDLELKPNILIAGLVRGRRPVIPTGDDFIQPGDRVIVLAAGHQLHDLDDIIRDR